MCSLNLNPIENLWRMLQKFMKEVDSTQQFLNSKNSILDAWEKIPLVQLQKLIDSMPYLIFEVFKANGGSAKY